MQGDRHIFGGGDIFDHCGDDEAEQRWEDLCDEFDGIAKMRDGLPPTNRQLYAMRVSWLETERHMKLRKSVKQQWNAQNTPQEEDAIMNAGRKTEDPSIKDAGLSGVAEAAVDPRLMPDPELVKQFQAQFVEPEPLREGASIYDLHGVPGGGGGMRMDDERRKMGRMFMTDDEEAHGLGRFKQGMHTPQVVADRSVRDYGVGCDHHDNAVNVRVAEDDSYVIVDGVKYVPEQHVLINREETIEEHLIRIGVTYKHRTAAKTGRVWLNVPADTLARAEGRPYTKEKKK